MNAADAERLLNTAKVLSVRAVARPSALSLCCGVDKAEPSNAGEDRAAPALRARDRARRAAVADVIASVLTVAAGSALILYGARGVVGASVAMDWLAQHGAPAEIRIQQLTADGFVASVRLGPPGAPDFVSERVEAAFTPAFGARSVRLVRPRLKLALVGGRLDFGALQPLVDDALQPKPASGPPPDVAIEDGTVELRTPAGPLLADGSGMLRGGALQRLDLAVRPAALRAGDVKLWLRSGRVQASGVPGGLKLTMQAAASRLAARGAEASELRLDASADVATRGLAPTGPIRAKASLAGAGLEAGGWRARAPAMVLEFAGVAHGPPTRLSISGSGRFAGALAALAGPASASAGRLDLDVRRLEFARRDGDVKLALDAGGLAKASAFALGRAGALTAPALRFDVARLTAALGSGQRRVSARVDASLVAAAAAMGGKGVHEASLALLGPVRLQGDKVGFSGAVRASGGADAKLRRALIEVPAIGPQLAAAAGRLSLSTPALSVDASPAALVVASAAPLTLEGPGARATVSPSPGSPLLSLARAGLTGAFSTAVRLPGLDAGLSGLRYALGADAGRASGRLTLAGDAGEARGVRLAADLAASRAGGVIRVVLAQCADAGLRAYGAAAADVQARLCPTGEPLLRSDGRGWAAAFGLADGRAVLPAGQVRLAGAGAASVSGDRGGLRRGRLDLARLAVSDEAAAPRFKPLTAAGAADLATGAWAGAFTIAESGRNRALGKVAVSLDAGSYAGRAVLDTAGLRFAQDGLQPSDITPLLSAKILGKAEGPLELTAEMAWSGAGALHSSGRVRTSGLDFNGPLGRVRAARGDIVLSSLAPLASPPGQVLTAESVAWLAPLSDVRLQFQLAPGALRLEAARAGVAGGAASLDPLTLALTPGAPIAGVLRLAAVDAGSLVAGSSLADKIKLQARLSGALPFSIAGDGAVRLAGGRLVADGPGRLSISRAALTGGVQTSGVQDFAYQALENLAFESLDAAVDSQPQGRLGVLFHVNGRHDPPVAVETRVGLIDLIRGQAFNRPLPLPKGTPVKLTLDTSLNFDELLAAYRGFNLGAERRSGGVQRDSGLSSAKLGGAPR